MVSKLCAHKKRPLCGLLGDLHEKQLDGSYFSGFKSKHVFSPNLVRHLNLDSELHGHDGCVNCLEWNQSGNLLASGSDDLNIMIWSPFKYRQDGQHEQNTQRLLSQTIPTKHRGNIFGVKFLPHTNDSLIASCAADRDVYIYDVNHSSRPLSSPRNTGDLPTPLHSIHAHGNRVKRLETSQSEPFLVWSCGEDGLVVEHDIRAPKADRSRVVVGFSKAKASLEIKSKDVRGNGKKQFMLANLEVKCLAVNQIRSEYLAVGCNDPFARVYDRRALRMRRIPDQSNPSKSIESCLFEYASNDPDNDSTPVRFFVPGHLPFKIEEYRKRMKTLSVTFLTFSPLGDQLLVNLGGEQLYLYDFITHDIESAPITYDSYRSMFKEEQIEINREKSKVELPSSVDFLKQKANYYFEGKKYVEAIEKYNEAIELFDSSPILFGNRAAALMKRGWEGDVYAAMRDCYQALELDGSHFKSHFRLAKCLNDLGWYHEALECLQLFAARFPDYVPTSGCENLQKEINENIRKTSGAVGRSKQLNSNKRFKAARSQDEAVSRREGNDSDSSESSEETGDSDGGRDNESKQIRRGEKQSIEKYRLAQEKASDFKKRYCGHCNVATDIKEASFIGEDFIAAGSDDGCLFIWNKKSTNIVRVLKGDESIVNCVQPHPNSCFLATSGIDPHVRIWAPRLADVDETNRAKVPDAESDEDESEEDSRVVRDIRAAEINNHRQMNSHPFEFLFLNLSQNWDNDDDETGRSQSIRCSQS